MAKGASGAIGLAALILAVSGCWAWGPQAGQTAPPAGSGAPAALRVPEVRGTVSFTVPASGAAASGSGTRFRAQTTLAEVANAATVSLIDPATGFTVASSVTEAAGGFVLTFATFSPSAGAAYVIEAVKGLSVGGKPNRPGAPAVRVRTLLFWNDGWQSLTNTTPGVGISVGAATTAVAAIASLKETAGQSITLTNLIGKISGSTFNPAGTGLSKTADFDPVLGLVGNALTLDQDPVAAIAFDSVRGTYQLATGMARAISIEPAIPSPGGTLTVRGAHFDPIAGRSIYWFGKVPAATWSLSADRSALTLPVPPNAISAPLTAQQPGGVTLALSPFLRLKGTVGTLAGSGVTGFADGPAAAAMFSRPYGIVVDSRGNVLVADTGNHRIRKITPSGEVQTIAGGDEGFADGQGAAARFSIPDYLAIDPADTLYVADGGNNRIRKITADGVVTTLAGGGTAGWQDGAGTAARFNYPHGIARASDGALFIADGYNHRIRRIDVNGVVTTLAGDGTAGFADGAGSAARFAYPHSGAIDGDGNLYIADADNYRVRKVTPAGVVTTFAGNGTPGTVDGVGTTAQINRPVGVGFDRSGNLLVAEWYGNRIRRITPQGAVTTLAGGGIDDFADGPLSAAQFFHPVGFAVDGAGAILVGDGGNARIRMMTP